jgi:exodeoxyribonuclease VII small subunit
MGTVVEMDFKPVEDLTYEAALEELEEIVRELESGERDLQVTLKYFERGQELASYCLSLLDEAELKVEEIMEDEEVDTP